jgi:competence protein ComEC
VTFLAVGQGDSIVVRSGGHLAVIDGGGVPGGADPGQRVVVPFLRHLGARRLDLVAMSHAHPDHGLGLPAVLEAFPADRVWMPAGSGSGELVEGLVEAAGDTDVEAVQAGDQGFALGDATVEILGPPVGADAPTSENDRSLVLRIRHRRVVILLPGDVEAAGERFLEPGQVTVMKAPHHGSDTSSTPELLDRARPRHAVFCVGRDNRFGFPRGAVVARYEALGARCYRTDLDGAITFRSDGEDVTVETFGPRELLEGRPAPGG